MTITQYSTNRNGSNRASAAGSASSVKEAQQIDPRNTPASANMYRGSARLGVDTPPRRKSLAALIALTLTIALVLWSLLGSYQIQEVVGVTCGLEDVVPCIYYDVTREVDLLDRYRGEAVAVATSLATLSTVALALTLRRSREPRRRG